MATTVARLEAVLSAQTRGFDRAMDRSESKMGKVGKAAGIAGLAIVGGLAVAAKIGFKEFIQGEKVTAQTNAALKSTGGIANVTAKHLDRLAKSMMLKTGIDDEAIRTSGNMLLTFTKIRNEVGKNNKIFDQATVAVADMATRMNQGATPSAEQLQKASIQLGKALQDPVKGATALARVGVQLDEQQKTLIKDLIVGKKAIDNFNTSTIEVTASQQEQATKLSKEGADWRTIADTLNLEVAPAQARMMDFWEQGGHHMKAQKIILQELNTEFKGSAEAAGKTFAGQLNILRESFANLMAVLVSAVFPHLLTLVRHLTAGTTWLQNNEKAAKILMVALGGLAGALLTARLAQLALNLAVLANPYVAAAASIVILSAALFVLWQRYENARGAIVLFISKFTPLGAALLLARNQLDDIGKAVLDLWEKAKAPIASLINGFKAIAGWIGKIIDGIKWLIDKVPDIPKPPGWLDPRNIGGGEGGKNPQGPPGPRGPIGNGDSRFTSKIWDEMAFAANMGMSIGANSSGRNYGDHGRVPSHAIDVYGSASQMSRFASAMYGRAGSKDIFYGPHSFWQDEGRMIQGWLGNQGLRNDHYDHVHYSVFDKGGWLKPGLTLAYNGTGASERVGGGNVTFNFPNYVGSRQELIGLLQNAAQEFKRRNGRSAF